MNENEIISIKGKDYEKISIGAAKDLTGKKFGQLIAISRVQEIGKKHLTKWLCQCDCGTIIVAFANNLTQNHTTSCGCYKPTFKDLTGQKFGKLTVIERSYEHPNENRVYWKVKCNCGTIKSIRGIELKSGAAKSCGHCYTNEMIGKKFGKLTVLALDENYKKEHNLKERIFFFKCKCDCNNIVTIRGTFLRSGHTISCGCINSSIGEYNITQLLEQNNVKYKKEKTFDNCINSDTNAKLRYDFYLSEYNRLIEFDGEQHFQSGKGWNTKENFERTQKADKIKNEYALSHNIPLVRIPYWERDKITLNMLLGDKYLVKGVD